MTELSPSELEALAVKVSVFAETLPEREREFFGALLALADYARRKENYDRIDELRAEAAAKFEKLIDEAVAVMITGVLHTSPDDDWPPHLKTRSSAKGTAEPDERDASRDPAGGQVEEFMDTLRSASRRPAQE